MKRIEFKEQSVMLERHENEAAELVLYFGFRDQH